MTKFDKWLVKFYKGDLRQKEVRGMYHAWQTAISYAIRTVNKSNDYDVIDNLKKLKK